MKKFCKTVRWVEQNHEGHWCVHEIHYGRQTSPCHHEEPTEHFGSGLHRTPLRSNRLDHCVGFLKAFDGDPLQGS